MNKEQALEKDLQCKKYIQKNKLRALFSQITRQILLKRPQKPIEFMIDYIEKRNKRSVICIQGYDEQKRAKISTSLSNKFNFHLINLSSILGGEQFYFKSNSDISNKVIEEIDKVDKVYRGIVISGFPNNVAQADALHKAGIIPERYFLLYNNQPAIRDFYAKKCSEEEAELMMDRNLLELKELKQLLRDQVDELPMSIDKALEKVNATVSIRFKKVVPLEAPRVVILHPPFVAPKALQNLVEKYSLHWVTLESSFQKACQKEGFSKFVASHIRQHKCLSKEVELALIETESKTSAAKNKGLLVSGWPAKKRSMPFLKQHFLNPHLVLIFTGTRDKVVDEFNKLDAKSQLFTICQKPSIEAFKADFKEYEQCVESLKGQQNCQFLSVNDSEAQVMKTFESVIENPKIYS